MRDGLVDVARLFVRHGDRVDRHRNRSYLSAIDSETWRTKLRTRREGAVQLDDNGKLSWRERVHKHVRERVRTWSKRVSERGWLVFGYAAATVGALSVAMAVTMSLPMMARTAVSELTGLAVAQTATLWNNVKDAAVGDNLTTGILASALMMYDGTNFDRARGTTANGLLVDVSRIQGSITPADGTANPTNLLGVGSFPSLYNGTTWDRARSASAANNIATTSLGAMYTVPLSTWSTTNSPAASAQATTSKAAGGGTVRHVATGVIGCFFGQATVTGPAAGIMQLRNGASGAGTVLATWYFSIEATDETANIPCVTMTGLNITGSANTAMTLEFTAGVTNAAQTVTLMGYSTP